MVEARSEIRKKTNQDFLNTRRMMLLDKPVDDGSCTEKDLIKAKDLLIDLQNEIITQDFTKYSTNLLNLRDLTKYD